jgi:hypothetical protein
MLSARVLFVVGKPSHTGIVVDCGLRELQTEDCTQKEHPVREESSTRTAAVPEYGCESGTRRRVRPARENWRGIASDCELRNEPNLIDRVRVLSYFAMRIETGGVTPVERPRGSAVALWACD